MKGISRLLRTTFRSLFRRPGLAVTAVVTLGLGIGAVGAVFSIVEGVVLRPLPYPSPDRLVMIWSSWRDFPKTWVSEPEFNFYRKESKSLEDIGLFWTGGANLTGGGGEPERVAAGYVSANLFEVLGTEPVLGRSFTWEENRPGASDVVVLGNTLWKNRFGGDPGLLGKTVQIDGRPKTVVGVMPPGFRLPLDFKSETPSQLWLPLELELAAGASVPANGGDHSYYSVGRLRPGVSAARAGTELDALADRLTAEGIYPASWHFQPRVIPVLDDLLGPVRKALAVLLAAMALVLVVACANVALLLLARGNQRRQELAVRTALGARRRELVRQLLVEAVMLAVLGWVVGVALARAGLSGLLTLAPGNVPRIGSVVLDPIAILFMFLVSLVAAIAAGILPAWRSSRVDPQSALREGGRTHSLGSGGRSFQAMLVAGEMALAVVLVIGAGLMVRSFWNLLHVDVGFRADHVLSMRLSPSSLNYEEGEKVSRFYDRLLDRLRQMPGVESAGAVRLLPLASSIGDWGIDVEGYEAAPGERVKGDWQVATPGYFETMGIQLRSGRLFTERDRADSRSVIIVNESMARKFWPGEDPLGKRVRVRGAKDSPWSTVVGVVGDVRHNGITAEIKEKWYLPLAQFYRSTGFSPTEMSVVLKSSLPLAELVPRVRKEVFRYDPTLPIADVRSVADLEAKAVSPSRLTMLLMVISSAMALLLAIVGTYGVIGYSVGQRRHEIGLRMALGAPRRSVLGMVVRQGMAVVLTGIVTGGVAALLLSRFLRGLLYGIETHDIVTFVASLAVLVVVALGATYFPARKVSGIDPLGALRNE